MNELPNDPAKWNHRLKATLDLALGDGTAKHALAGSLLVGSVLVAINHGDMILDGLAPSVWKVLLTYAVPYCVMTYGAVTQQRIAARRAAARDG